MAVMSAVLLGLYDVAKKKALQKNGVLAVLLVATALSTLFLSPFFKLGPGEDYIRLAFKAVLVTLSWISGMIGLKMLPLTTVSTIKGSRPVFVVLLSVLIYSEKLNWMQWSGIALALIALWMLGRSSRSDGTVKARRTGFIFMGVSVATGVASAVYDKHIISGMDPLFVQCWTNLFITVLLAVCVGVQLLARERSSSRNFRYASSLPLTQASAGPSHSCGHGRPQFRENDLSPANSCEDELAAKEKTPRFQWDWTLLVVAVLITAADMLYFFALKQPGALLSVISVVRRGSILVTFVCGAILFKEGNLKAKGLNMLVMVAGIVLLLLGS
jgi:transporter family protein